MIISNFSKSEWQILKAIHETASRLNVQAFPIGGYVRNKILGIGVKDIDIVTDGDGIQLAKALASEFNIPEDKVYFYSRFGTAMIKINEYELEFVGARKESYSSASRKPEVTKGSIQDDQLRRDFTINAMAITIGTDSFGSVIDPFNGLSDLSNRVIKTPMDPDKTFSDDPLRMMRAVRFATQLNFEIDPITWKGLKNKSSRIGIISFERISDELNKIILTSKPSRGFIMLEESGILPLILPELSAMKGVEIIKGIGHKDNFFHTLEVLDNISSFTNNLYLRWAAILHDIAKPVTKRFVEGVGWTFHSHEIIGERMASTIFKRLKMPLDHKLKYVQKLIRLHLRPIGLSSEEITDSAIRRLLFEAGEDIEDLMILAEADITSKNENKVNKYLNNYKKVRSLLQQIEDKDKLRNWQPPVTGQMIMEIFNLKPGKVVGDLKNLIREAILEGTIKNDKKEAIQYLFAKAEELGLKPLSK
jgi:putative nucleotidyltransferase with HDIG domain